jgi:dCMP deaminase
MNRKTEYFMGLAEAVATASKDPSSKVGCVIVRPDGSVACSGYNGMIKGVEESQMWEPREMKLATVIHAEMNAILHKREELTGYSLYVTHAPCCNCLKHALQAGIKAIYYKDSSIMRRTDYLSNKAVSMLLEATGITAINVTNKMSYENEIYDHVNNLETRFL